MRLRLSLLSATLILLAACGGQSAPPADAPTAVADSTVAAPPAEISGPTATPGPTFVFIEGDAITTASGLQYALLEEGDGPSPQPGDVVQLHYVARFSDGVPFDSSYDRDKPLQFVVGSGQVIPGMDEAIRLLKVGDKAKIIIPPDLAYGETGVGQDIPPNATLYFEVELLDAHPADDTPPTQVAEEDYVVTDSGLKYYDIKVGEGDSPRRGEMPLVHYVGWLEDGTKIDSSRDRGTPLHFTLGGGQVIPGWEEGILGMKVGGIRQLVIPPELAFGEKGAGNGLIPPNATLIYEVELLSISEYHP